MPFSRPSAPLTSSCAISRAFTAAETMFQGHVHCVAPRISKF
jgi:hypothetical protein